MTMTTPLALRTVGLGGRGLMWYEVLDGRGDLIAQAEGENAEIIVGRVNGYAALQERLEAAERVMRDLVEWGSDSCPNCGSEFIEGCEADHCAYYPIRAYIDGTEREANDA